MRSVLIAFLIATTPVALAGCATAKSVNAAAVDQGTPHDFAAPYDLVKAAALEGINRLNVNVQSTDETPERFQIRFTKSISAFSWGEVGAVNVVRVDDANSRVYVNSAKRSQMQITGTSEREFAEKIFENISESLARIQN